MYIIFDTETTGLPKNWKSPVSDLDNWPRLVQLAWLKYDLSGNLISSKDYIIKPSGFDIPPESTKIHRISTEKANKEGIELKQALEEFSKDLDEAENLIAHNISFDEKIIGAEFLRQNIPNKLEQISKICTQKGSTKFCQLPGRYGYKWPKLSELHYILFDETFEDAHNALDDVQACARCFFKLKRLKVF